MKRALVTGAGGFVGANLVRRLLADGHAVHPVVGPETDTWRLDGLDAPVARVDLSVADEVDQLVAQVAPDWIFHLAANGAYSWQVDMRRIVAVNVAGAANLLEAALAAGFESFVNAGSSSEYGLKTQAPGEADAIDPNSTYAVTKAAATMLFRHASLAHEIPITTLRLYSVYGPWEDPRRLIPALVLAGLEGRLPPLVDPAIARDFVYVDDVIEAFVLAASSPLAPGAVLNIASGVQTTVGDAVEVTKRVLSISEQPAWGSLPQRMWDTSSWVGDPSHAVSQLGWQPSHDFEQGFRATVEWAQAVGWPDRLTGS